MIVYKLYKPSFWVLIAGILMIIMGIYAWIRPAITLADFTLYVGIIFIIAGAGYLVAYLAGMRSTWYIAFGLLHITVGIVFVSYIREIPLLVPFLFAFWCMFAGIIQIASSVQFHRLPNHRMWGWSMVAGIIGIIVGMWILFGLPMNPVLSFPVLIGIYLVINGLSGVIDFIGSRSAYIVDAADHRFTTVVTRNQTDENLAFRHQI